jgi:putative flavoprotein involved in K+ transport
MTTQARLDASRVERFEAVVIGGGQAGLAAAYELAKRDVDYVVLSDEQRVGDNWRRRWDSLRLFTPARFSSLPGMPFPAPSMHLADKDEVADYLERYVERMDLSVRLGARVASVSRDGERYRVTVHGSAGAIEADNIVVATGAFHKPFVPDVAGQLAGSIHQLHSSAYRNPLVLPDGPVLVVGAGNSGAQIALELAQSRKVWLAGRNTGHLPRRLLGRDVFTWIWPVARHATTRTALGRRMRAQVRRGGDALIGIAESELTRAGITRVGRLQHVRGGQPVCGDSVLQPRVIVWCTGYRVDYQWIDAPVFDDDGSPRHDAGLCAGAPGLFFVGLRFQHRLTSSLIGGVGDDARRIAANVAARCEAVLDDGRIGDRHRPATEMREEL